MKDVNLLPTDLLKKTGTRKIASDLQNFVVIGFSIFLLFVVGGIFYIVILSFQARNLAKKQDNLEGSIKALEKTEQEVVLVKDRIKKTENILTSNDAYKEIVNFDETILSYTPPGVIITEAKVDKEFIDISYSVSSSSLLVGLFKTLSNPEVFSKIRLDSLSFSPSVGYILNLRIYSK